MTYGEQDAVEREIDVYERIIAKMHTQIDTLSAERDALKEEHTESRRRAFRAGFSIASRDNTFTPDDWEGVYNSWMDCIPTPSQSQDIQTINQQGGNTMNNDILAREIASVINKHSRENESHTPDFILAEYLVQCLTAFEAATKTRAKWYNKKISDTI